MRNDAVRRGVPSAAVRRFVGVDIQASDALGVFKDGDARVRVFNIGERFGRLFVLKLLIVDGAF